MHVTPQYVITCKNLSLAEECAVYKNKTQDPSSYTRTICVLFFYRNPEQFDGEKKAKVKLIVVSPSHEQIYKKKCGPGSGKDLYSLTGTYSCKNAINQHVICLSLDFFAARKQVGYKNIRIPQNLRGHAYPTK